MISDAKKKTLHLLIGTRLLISTPSDKIDDAVFDIVRHMNKGSELIHATEQREEVSQLNLLAGEKAMESFSFHSAATYFLAAISLSSGEEFFLLKVYGLSLKPLFSIGDFVNLVDNVW